MVNGNNNKRSTNDSGVPNIFGDDSPASNNSFTINISAGGGNNGSTSTEYKTRRRPAQLYGIVDRKEQSMVGTCMANTVIDVVAGA